MTELLILAHKFIESAGRDMPDFESSEEWIKSIFNPSHKRFGKYIIQTNEEKKILYTLEFEYID